MFLDKLISAPVMVLALVAPVVIGRRSGGLVDHGGLCRVRAVRRGVAVVRRRVRLRRGGRVQRHHRVGVQDLDVVLRRVLQSVSVLRANSIQKIRIACKCFTEEHLFPECPSGPSASGSKSRAVSAWEEEGSDGGGTTVRASRPAQGPASCGGRGCGGGGRATGSPATSPWRRRTWPASRTRRC